MAIIGKIDIFQQKLFIYIYNNNITIYKEFLFVDMIFTYTIFFFFSIELFR